MEIIDVFRQDAFSAVTLGAQVNKVPFKPSFLGSLGIFEPMNPRTTDIAIVENNGVLSLIPTSSRGAPATPRSSQRRKMRRFETQRLFHDDTIYAHELQNIVQYTDGDGQVVTVLKQLQDEVALRMAGPDGLQASMEYTWENHRLGAIKGILLDADGTTEIYDFFSEFGISQPASIFFDLAAQTENTIKAKCNEVIRGMARAAQGAFTSSTQVYGLCSDSFYDALVTHPDVRESYLRWINAGGQPGTSPVDGGMAPAGSIFAAFYWGGVYWLNYRGSDDGTTIAATADQCHFFPVNAPGVFKVAWGPGESFPQLNQPGVPLYPMVIPDLKRYEKVDLELKSYPLHICTRPGVLFTGELAGS